MIYCLRLDDGGLIWEVRPGSSDELIPGNGRLISRWPIRTSVLVDNGAAYACAGLFPSQGVIAVALDARTGELRWRRSIDDRSPQGYLLAAGKLVVVPTGRANPFSLRRDTGEMGPAFSGVGGTYAVVVDGHLLSGRGNDNTIAESNAATGANLVRFPGKHLAVSPRYSFMLTTSELAALDRRQYNQLRSERDNLARRLKARGGKDAALKREMDDLSVRMTRCFLWKSPSDSSDSLIVAGASAYVGGNGKVRVYDAATGEHRYDLSVKGRALALAADQNRLVVTTDRGTVYCFGAGRTGADSPRQGVVATKISVQSERAAAAAVAHLDAPRGYALVLGESTSDMPRALAAVSELNVVAVHRDRAAVERLRAQLHKLGEYGRRISVQHAPNDRLPFTDYFANLVIVSDAAEWSTAEIERVTVPGRGVIVSGTSVARRPPLDGVGAWTHQYANLANTSNSGDLHTTSQLALQWFGAPGPQRMIDRHMRGPPPLAVGGLMFVVGENRLIGLDAYNGTELWDTELPDSQRYAMPYDCGYIAARADAVFAAVDDRLWVLEAISGRKLREIALPKIVRGGRHWGYVGIDGNALYGSAVLPSAPRTEPGRGLADLSYRSGRPIVTSQAIFRMSAKSGELSWLRETGAILNPTITVADGNVYFVESRNDAAASHETGRIELSILMKENAWLMCLDATTGDVRWQKPLEAMNYRSSLYLLYTDRKLVLVGSHDGPKKDALYDVRALDAGTGDDLWRKTHPNRKPGQLGHGEQVHHPVVLGDILVAEPFLYRLSTGERINPDGGAAEWTIQRPGHSCGTMSGSGTCVFFRANNPTVLDLGPGVKAENRFRKLSPSRPGCWINIIPADGLVLIPEASASCVCLYSLQTSMAFRPR